METGMQSIGESSERGMKCVEQLSEEERRALRGSKFAPLPPSLPSTSRPQPRLAHPGGPLKTNKAAALAKFLERKLQEDPIGLATIDPDVLHLAVQNAKASVFDLEFPSITESSRLLKNARGRCGTSNSGTTVRHVDSFDKSKDCAEERNPDLTQPIKRKKKTKTKKKTGAIISAEKMKKKKKKKQKVDCF